MNFTEEIFQDKSGFPFTTKIYFSVKNVYIGPQLNHICHATIFANNFLLKFYLHILGNSKIEKQLQINGVIIIIAI